MNVEHDLLAGLNEPQREAVTAGEGPILVLAGPGSGKTRVLTHRIAYLIEHMRVYPNNILAVTFTNKAAGEMRERVERITGGRLRGLQIGTFHAICARILRTEAEFTPYSEDYVIYDTDDQLKAVEQAANEIRVDSKKFTPRRLLYAISTLKNELVTPSEAPANDYFGEVVARVYPHYQAILIDSNAMDFDDLLMQTVLLLRSNDAVREKYQRRFDFVLIDEFQDTNMAQYEMVQLAGAPRNNIFVVGDEDQSIYAFRGADYRNVLQFRKDYADCKTILLEQNYRSTQLVLDAARAVIDQNSNRTPKALFTDREGGEKVSLYEAYNETYEAEYVLEQINRLRKREGYGYSDFAIMYRTNAQSRAMEDACIREGVPYVLVGGVGFYKRTEIKDLLAYLRLINNPNDKISFARICNVPKRGIGQTSLKQFQQWAADANISYAEALDTLIAGGGSPLAGRAAKLFADFGRQLNQWREIAQMGDPLELFDAIVADTGFNLYLREISDNDEQAIERSENVSELRGLLARAREENIPLNEFLAEQALVADVDSLKVGSEAVTLLTLHAAKGLEYNIVFIVGLEEGLLPHVRSLEEPEGMSEERRLLYVGITRARDRLFLSYAFRRMQYGGSGSPSIPSRFLADIPMHLVDGVAPKMQQTMFERQGYLQQTKWESAPKPSRLQQDLQTAKNEGNSAVRSKITPFPGGPSLQFKSGMRVNHALYGRGIVVGSQRSGDDEEVSVAFDDKKAGLKRLLASVANLKKE